MHSLRAYHVVFASVLLGFAAFALADIVSGSSSTGSSSNVTISRLVISKPQAVAQGDVLVAGIALEAGPSASVTAPEGWALIERTNNGSHISVLSFWKRAGAQEPPSYTWEIAPQTRAVGGITAYSGVDGAEPVQAVAEASGSGKTAVASSVTTTDAGATTITLFAYPSSMKSGNNFSTPNGMIEKYDTAKWPGGPSLASHDQSQVAAGVTGTKSSLLGSKKNWVAQHIALRSAQPAPSVTADDFDSYADGDLNGLNGGTGWTGPWTGDAAFDVQGSVVAEGAKALMVNVSAAEEPSITRTFAPKTSGVLHWVQRKDGIDQGAHLAMRSGSTRAIVVGIGSSAQPKPGGPDWFNAEGTFTPEGHQESTILRPYTVGSFDEVDLEFDTATDKYRVAFNGGPYTEWKPFENPAESLDTLQIYIGSSGFNIGPSYWDDIRFDN